jgi:ElaB/YqjD/DUF883 family membrane-anchored ribosome-binding protein
MDKNGMTETLDETLDSLTEGARNIVDVGASKVDAVKTRLVDFKDQAVARGDDLLSRTAALIQANPMKSVAIAFGAGGLLWLGSRLLRR